MAAGEIVWSLKYGQPAGVVSRELVWACDQATLYLLHDRAVVREPAAAFCNVDHAPAAAIGFCGAIAAASRIADALSRDEVLTPIQSSLIPLPHQFHALARAISSDRMRFLLADEVGLGKTIEAGLILRELKLRGLVKRVLVVAPKGLVTQWVSEMCTHFGEQFRLVLAEDFAAYGRFAPGENLWRAFNQVVCPLDTVKPVEARRGWSNRELEARNRERFEDLIAAGWDLVIVDEAHKLGGSVEDVARHRLGQALAAATPYLLLLSATPHQGKTEAFRRLLALVDPLAFPDEDSVTREKVREVCIRTEKRRAVDADGSPLFKPRTTRLEPVAWAAEHELQHQLYDAVTEYVRHGYDRAVRERRSYLAFLVLLMQRLVTSSTRAIRVALERRLAVLDAEPEQLALFPSVPFSDLEELDGQEQLEALASARLSPLDSERGEVAWLLDLAQRAESAGPDAKAQALLGWLYRLQREERDPALKVLVFTEFVPTQEMLRDYLTGAGFRVTCLNGSMDIDARQQVQAEFAGEAQVLVSTDAGGEGLNLQFCHVVVNFDLPWNPMRIEQRIGRVDRIGQRHQVRALNLVLRDTVEHRVREVLEEKLGIIFQELGVDKTADVLDSEVGGAMFEQVFAGAIQAPESIDAAVAALAERLRAEATATRSAASLLSGGDPVDAAGWQRVMAHPLPFWVERMVVGHVRSSGGAADRRDGGWWLRWPDGHEMQRVVFTSKDAQELPGAVHLTLEQPRVRALVDRLPRFVPGQPIPLVRIAGLPEGVIGLWSVWRIVLHAGEAERQRIMPLFVHDDGRVLPPTARAIWDALIEQDVTAEPLVCRDGAAETLADLTRLAEEHGRPVWEELVLDHRRRIDRDREKAATAFAARRRALERIGLPAVRAHRLRQLDDEERAELARLQAAESYLPELVPVVVVRVV